VSPYLISFGDFPQKLLKHRLELDVVRYPASVPIGIGGVAVYPGDVVVADGHGVVVVPTKVARDAAKYAMQELKSEMQARGRTYEKLGWEKDNSVL
jgi:regulator of RNase E activity RraA